MDGEEEDPVIEYYGGYQTRDRKQVTILIPALAVKTHNSGHIHLNTGMTEEEKYNHILHIIMTQYALKSNK